MSQTTKANRNKNKICQNWDQTNRLIQTDKISKNRLQASVKVCDRLIIYTMFFIE